MRRAPMFLLVAMAACAPKAEDVPSTRTDSTAVVDSVRADSIRADSVRRDSVRADTIPSVSSKSRPAPIIGRDSAFGPTHTIDAKGKVTPIKKP